MKSENTVAVTLVDLQPFISTANGLDELLQYHFYSAVNSVTMNSAPATVNYVRPLFAQTQKTVAFGDLAPPSQRIRIDTHIEAAGRGI